MQTNIGHLAYVKMRNKQSRYPTCLPLYINDVLINDFYIFTAFSVFVAFCREYDKSYLCK